MARSVRLDRDTIVDAAVRVLDRVGLDAFSTRGLAAELGVQSPALYWHFPSKRHLLDAMAEHMGSLHAEVPPLAPGQEIAGWLVRLGTRFRAVLLSCRDGARLHAGTTPPEASLPALAARVDGLVGRGMSSDQALRTLLVISRYTIGWVLEEQAEAARGVTGPQAAAETFGAYPTLAAGLAVVLQQDADAGYEYGLRSLVGGLVDAAERPRSDGRAVQVLDQEKEDRSR